MHRSPLLTHDPPVTQPVAEGVQLQITASRWHDMHLVAQITAVCGAPFHSGRLDLLNPRSCDAWAREVAMAWESSRTDRPSIGPEEFKRALRLAELRLQALHERAAAPGRAVIDEQPPYVIRERRICRLHDGRIEPLCDFSARITREVLIDDGAVECGELSIEGVLDDG